MGGALAAVRADARAEGAHAANTGADDLLNPDRYRQVVVPSPPTHTRARTRTHPHTRARAHITRARRHECAQRRARTRAHGDAAVLDSSWVGTRRRCGYRPHARTCSSGLGLSIIAGLPYRSNAHKAYGLGRPIRVPTTARIRPCEYPEYLRCPRAPLRVSARPAAQTHAAAAHGAPRSQRARNATHTGATCCCIAWRRSQPVPRSSVCRPSPLTAPGSLRLFFLFVR
jgi:hypothetical protein